MEPKSEIKNIDSLLFDLGGCGRFQITTTALILSIKVVSSMSMMMMAFGNHNPGWKCLDKNYNNNYFDNSNNSADTLFGFAERQHRSANVSLNYTDECQLFESCSHVEFTPGISTIVSEWHLLCDKAWISSIIISLQMAGVALGSCLAGYLADAFGRKKIIYGANMCHMALNIITMFSTSWQWFATMRFLIGVCIPLILNLPVIYAMEYVQPKWRSLVQVCPVFGLGNMLFALSALATKDWRYIHATNAAVSLVTSISFFWMPESLRWLVVKNKLESALTVVKKIARVNRTGNQESGPLNEVSDDYNRQSGSMNYSCLNLMHKGSRRTTIIIGFVSCVFSLIYYAIGFGIKSLPGDLYTNMILIFIAEFPMACISAPLPNYTGRKKAIFLSLIVCTVSLFAIVGLDKGGALGEMKTTGTLVFAIIGRATVDAAWDILMTFIAELYPTVVRSTAFGYSSWCSRIGGIVSPYLISNDAESYFINYLIMSVCALICCFMIFSLPETKGKPLPDIVIEKTKDQLLKSDAKEKVDESGKYAKDLNSSKIV